MSLLVSLSVFEDVSEDVMQGVYNIVCDGLSVFAWVFANYVKVQIPRVAGKKSFNGDNKE